MSAKTLTAKLKNAGVGAGKGETTKVDPRALTLFTDPNHILYDKRLPLPLDEAMLADMDKHGQRTACTVRSNGETADGVPILEVVDGQRRVRHMIEVNKRREARGDEPYRLEFKSFRGSDADMLLFRIGANSHTQAESVSTLAPKISMAMKLGKDAEEICVATGLSKYRLGQVLAYLELSDAARAAIDTGTLPLGSITELQKVPQSDQAAVVEQLIAAGATKRHEIEDEIKAIRTGGGTNGTGTNGDAPGNGPTGGNGTHGPDAGAARRPKTRKRAWGRREMKLFQEAAAKQAEEEPTVAAALALVSWFVDGDDSWKGDYPALWKAVGKVKRKAKAADQAKAEAQA